MALTRAQLLMGDAGQGALLTGQVKAVKQGPGIAIATDGTITVDSQTIQGVLKLGQTPASALAAFNGYTWPTTAGTGEQQLTTDGTGILSWSDPVSLPYSAKGQIVVGTGVNTDEIVNVGVNTAFLVADSGTTSGVRWSDTSTSAAQMPSGSSGQRPSPATAGQIRFNNTTGKFEFYSGLAWEQVASGDPSVGTFVSQTVAAAPIGATGNALIPGGGTAQRQTLPAPVPGSTRYNTDTGKLEVYGGAGLWESIPSAASGGFVPQTAPSTGSPSAVVPVGTNANRQTVPAPVGGYLRFNTDTTLLEVFNGTLWVPAGGAGLKPIDDITSQFNGVQTSFLLQVAGQNLLPIYVGANLLIWIGGSIQDYSTAFTYNSATSTITFSSPPPTGELFIGKV